MFLDSNKAFDEIAHNILLNKIEACGNIQP